MWKLDCLFLQGSVAWMEKPPALAHSLCTENSKSVANNETDFFQVCFSWKGRESNCLWPGFSWHKTVFSTGWSLCQEPCFEGWSTQNCSPARKWQAGVPNVTFYFSLLDTELFEKHLQHCRVLSFFYPNNFHIKCTLLVFKEANCPCQHCKTQPRVWKSIMFLLPCMSSPCN